MDQPVMQGAVLETTLTGTLFNQLVMNILHYRLDGPTTPIDGSIAIDQFHGLFRAVGNVWDKWKACMGPEALNLHLRHQWIYPTRFRSITPGFTLEVGTATGTCPSANHAIALSKWGVLAGRGRTGTMHMFGVVKQDQTNGTVTTGSETKFNVLGAQMLNSFTLSPTGTLTPVIYDRKAPGSSQQLKGVTLQSTLRVQRRRTVGVGK